ncbi:alpha/beta fold hydrolase [Paraburkholderia sp. J12]|uniref:alpha/beta fold hydrolase n=1 Tax=Paraburkholderia sp. J12 TaxID=2805432 RepID=UPI0039F5D5F6
MNPIATLPLTIAAAAAALAVAGAGLAAFSRRTARRIEQAVPMDGQLIDIGGDRIHYVERGEGPPIVFVHGLSGQMRNFAYLPIDALARHHRVILIDRPGTGYSTRGPRSAANVYAQAETVVRFFAALGLDKPVLVGHSLGGAVALAVALNHPQAVSRLALIAPLTHVQTEVPKAFRALVIRSAFVRRIVARTLATPVALATSATVLKQVFAPEAVPADFPQRGGGMLSLRPQGFLGASEDLVAIEGTGDLADMEQRYAQLEVDTDVLFGRGDIVLNWIRHGDALRRRSKRVALKVVEGGHMLPVTAPQATAAWLQAVVSGATARGVDGGRETASAELDEAVQAPRKHA